MFISPTSKLATLLVLVTVFTPVWTESVVIADNQSWREPHALMRRFSFSDLNPKNWGPKLGETLKKEVGDKVMDAVVNPAEKLVTQTIIPGAEKLVTQEIIPGTVSVLKETKEVMEKDLLPTLIDNAPNLALGAVVCVVDLAGCPGVIVGEGLGIVMGTVMHATARKQAEEAARNDPDLRADAICKTILPDGQPWCDPKLGCFNIVLNPDSDHPELKPLTAPPKNIQLSDKDVDIMNTVLIQGQPVWYDTLERCWYKYDPNTPTAPTASTAPTDPTTTEIRDQFLGMIPAGRAWCDLEETRCYQVVVDETVQPVTSESPLVHVNFTSVPGYEKILASLPVDESWCDTMDRCWSPYSPSAVPASDPTEECLKLIPNGQAWCDQRKRCYCVRLEDGTTQAPTSSPLQLDFSKIPGSDGVLDGIPTDESWCDPLDRCWSPCDLDPTQQVLKMIPEGKPWCDQRGRCYEVMLDGAVQEPTSPPIQLDFSKIIGSDEILDGIPSDEAWCDPLQRCWNPYDPSKTKLPDEGQTAEKEAEDDGELAEDDDGVDDEQDEGNEKVEKEGDEEEKDGQNTEKDNLNGDADDKIVTKEPKPHSKNSRKKKPIQKPATTTEADDDEEDVEDQSDSNDDQDSDDTGETEEDDTGETEEDDTGETEEDSTDDLEQDDVDDSEPAKPLGKSPKKHRPGRKPATIPDGDQVANDQGTPSGKPPKKQRPGPKPATSPDDNQATNDQGTSPGSTDIDSEEDGPIDDGAEELGDQATRGSKTTAPGNQAPSRWPGQKPTEPVDSGETPQTKWPGWKPVDPQSSNLYHQPPTNPNQKGYKGHGSAPDTVGDSDCDEEEQAKPYQKSSNSKGDDEDCDETGQSKAGHIGKQLLPDDYKTPSNGTASNSTSAGDPDCDQEDPGNQVSPRRGLTKSAKQAVQSLRRRHNRFWQRSNKDL